MNRKVMFLPSPRNLGYFGGAAYGLNRYLESHPLPEWVVVSNVDIEFRDREFVNNLVCASRPDGVGVLAPSILSSITGGDLNPFMVHKPRRAVVRFRKAVFSNPYTLNLYESGSLLKHTIAKMLRHTHVLRGVSSTYRVKSSRHAVRQIYAPHASCIVFSKAYFECGGGLQYPLFLYGEDTFVAETARGLNMMVVYDPSLRLWHDEHTSTGLLRSRGIAAHVGEAAAYIAEHYY
jgi:GT2 family glycosyltransferase